MLQRMEYSSSGKLSNSSAWALGVTARHYLTHKRHNPFHRSPKTFRPVKGIIQGILKNMKAKKMVLIWLARGDHLVCIEYKIFATQYGVLNSENK